MTSLLVSFLLFAALAAGILFAYARTLPGPMEDELLYSGADPAYQAIQAYWGELGQARDWEGLKLQVRRWQQVTAPGCSESEVEQMARHLNQAVFRFAMPMGEGTAVQHA
jgi:hypothetical protein